MSRRIITIVVIFAVVFAGGLSAILINAAHGAFQPVATTPHTTQSVSGNGGNAVAVGEYLYFIGNFVPTSTITYRQNEHNRVVVNDRANYGGIFRVPLGGAAGNQVQQNRWNNWVDEYGSQIQGRPLYDNNHLSRPFPNDADNATYHGGAWNARVVGKELIVPKIAGHESSAMWIFGNHLVYTSPHNRLNRFGQLQSARTDFFRVNLDGSGHRLLYTTAEANVSRNNFDVVWGGNRAHLIVMDGNRLVQVDVTTAARPRTLAENATSFAIPQVTSFYHTAGQTNKGFDGVMGFVYWTQDRPDDQGPMGYRGNLLRRWNIATRRVETLADAPSTRYTVHSLSAGRLIFRMERLGMAQSEANRTVLLIASGDQTDAELYADAHIQGNFQALSLNGTVYAQMNFFAPTEWSGSSSNAPIFGQHQNGNIFRFVPLDAPVNNNRFAVVSGAVAEGVNEIITITSNRIMFVSGGEVHTVNHQGQQVVAPRPMTGSVTGARATFFQVLPHMTATNLEFEFFIFFRTIESSDFDMIPDIGENGEEVMVPGPRATKTVAIMVDGNGVEWVLANLDDEFVN